MQGRITLANGGPLASNEDSLQDKMPLLKAADTLAQTLRIMPVMVCCITVQRQAKEPTALAQMGAQSSRHLAPTGLAAPGD